MSKHSLIILVIVLLSTGTIVSCMLLSGVRGELEFDPDSLPAAHVGTAYDVKLHVTQNKTPVGAFSMPKGALPAGLELEPVDGEEDTARISGVPEESGTFSFTISVWCYGTNVSGQTGEQEYSLVVEE